ncbi:hypothetical protein [Klebsiella oxytoca]|uniref:hypothetical protein n=1 Tax=Klebsiella oxytoca TaxID=571 RepID=UPI003A8CF0C8
MKYALYAIVLILFVVFILSGSFTTSPEKEKERGEVADCQKKEGADCTTLTHDFQERWGENP